MLVSWNRMGRGLPRAATKTPTVMSQQRPSSNGDQPEYKPATNGASGSQSLQRRRGKAALLPGPSDTPLRDINRDRLMGLLTDRATRTLLYYFMELNPTLHNWLYMYLKANEIPMEGHWADVSGETFLRKLLGSPLEITKYDFNGRPEMFSCAAPMGVDPRQIAQRIMEIRSQIAREWIEELKGVSEENALLMRECVLSSFTLDVEKLAAASTHPEMRDYDREGPDDSAIGGDD